MSLADTIRNTMVPVHREGWPFVAAFAAGAILLGWLWDPLFYVGVALTAWCAYFFRDPPRVTPLDDDLVISRPTARFRRSAPRPRRRTRARRRTAYPHLDLHGCLLGAHQSRPGPRRSDGNRLRPGKFLNADLDKASTENERNGPRHRQPARTGRRRAGCRSRRAAHPVLVEDRDELTAGERFGLIRFGSRVDLYLPEGAVPRVALGQTAVAGETVIADYRADAATAPSRTS